MAVAPVTEWGVTTLAHRVGGGGDTTVEHVHAALVTRYETDMKHSNAMTKDFSPVALRKELAAGHGATGGESTPASRPAARPLEGVPFVVSACLDIGGKPTTAGLVALERGRAVATAPVVLALQQAGACLFGTANMPPLGLGITAHNATHGTCRNPFSATGTAGGSQCGIAAAVAGRFVPAGVGQDVTGDVRVPAALCGVVGVRPTLGRYPPTGMLTLSPTLGTAGLVARTVADVQRMDAVIVKAAAMRAAATTAAEEAAAVKLQAVGRGYLQRKRGHGAADTTPSGRASADESRAEGSGSGPTSSSTLHGLRLGVPRASFYAGLHPSVAPVVEAFLARLVGAGVEVVEADFDGLLPAGVASLHDMASAVVDPVLGYECLREVAAFLTSHTAVIAPKEAGGGGEGEEEVVVAASPLIRPLDAVVPVSTVVAEFNGAPSHRAWLQEQADPATAVTSSAYRTALVHDRPALQAVLTAYVQAHGVHAVLYPTTLAPAAVLRGEDKPQVDMGGGALVDAGLVYGRNVKPASAAGWPAVTIPIGVTKPVSDRDGVPPGTTGIQHERLPVGMELMAPPDMDERLWQWAAAVQGLQSLLPDPIILRRWNEGVYVPVAPPPTAGGAASEA